MRLHASPSTSSRPVNTSRSGLAAASFQLAAKRIEVQQLPGLPFSVLGAHSCGGLDGQVLITLQGPDGCEWTVSWLAPYRRREQIQSQSERMGS